MRNAETFPAIRTQAQEVTQQVFVRYAVCTYLLAFEIDLYTSDMKKILHKIEKMRDSLCKSPLQRGSTRLMQQITTCAKEMDGHLTNYLVIRYVKV